MLTEERKAELRALAAQRQQTTAPAGAGLTEARKAELRALAAQSKRQPSLGDAPRESAFARFDTMPAAGDVTRQRQQAPQITIPLTEAQAMAKTARETAANIKAGIRARYGQGGQYQRAARAAGLENLPSPTAGFTLPGIVAPSPLTLLAADRPGLARTERNVQLDMTTDALAGALSQYRGSLDAGTGVAGELRGAMQGAEEAVTNPGQSMPFLANIGNAVSAIERLGLLKKAQRVGFNGLTPQEQDFVRVVVATGEMMKANPPGGGQQAVIGLRDMIRYAGEFAATGGVGNVVKGAVELGVGKALPGTVLSKAGSAATEFVSGVAGGAVQSLTNIPQIAVTTLERQMPQFKAEVNPATGKATEIVLASKGEPWYEALARAVASNMANYGFERTGFVVDDAIAALVNKRGFAKFGKGWLQKLNAASDKAGINSIVSEVFEEELTEPFAAGAEKREYKAPILTAEGTSRLAVEFATFFLPTGAKNLALLSRTPAAPTPAAPTATTTPPVEETPAPAVSPATGQPEAVKPGLTPEQQAVLAARRAEREAEMAAELPDGMGEGYVEAVVPKTGARRTIPKDFPEVEERTPGTATIGEILAAQQGEPTLGTTVPKKGTVKPPVSPSAENAAGGEGGKQVWEMTADEFSTFDYGIMPGSESHPTVQRVRSELEASGIPIEEIGIKGSHRFGLASDKSDVDVYVRVPAEYYDKADDIGARLSRDKIDVMVNWTGVGKPGGTLRGDKTHKRLVERALKEGKPVPAEVLKDYPDLQPTPSPSAGKGEKQAWEPRFVNVPPEKQDIFQRAYTSLPGVFQDAARKYFNTVHVANQEIYEGSHEMLDHKTIAVDFAEDINLRDAQHSLMHAHVWDLFHGGDNNKFLPDFVAARYPSGSANQFAADAKQGHTWGYFAMEDVVNALNGYIDGKPIDPAVRDVIARHYPDLAPRPAKTGEGKSKAKVAAPGTFNATDEITVDGQRVFDATVQGKVLTGKNAAGVTESFLWNGKAWENEDGKAVRLTVAKPKNVPFMPGQGEGAMELRAGLDVVQAARDFAQWLKGATEAEQIAEAQRQYEAVEVVKDGGGVDTKPILDALDLLSTAWAGRVDNRLPDFAARKEEYRDAYAKADAVVTGMIRNNSDFATSKDGQAIISSLRDFGGAIGNHGQLLGAKNSHVFMGRRNHARVAISRMSEQPKFTPANFPSNAGQTYDEWVAKGRLLAPNGQPSKLNERPWRQVRTPAFKAWFGPWDTDPASASKVVDENGEPRVMMHGTLAEPFTEFYPFSHFGTDAAADNRLASLRGETEVTDQGAVIAGEPNLNESGGYVVPVFLRITRPLEVSDMGDDGVGWLHDVVSSISEVSPDTDSGLPTTPLLSTKEADEILNGKGNVWEAFQRVVKSKGYDGLEYYNIREGDISYVAFDPTQIKSALANRGTFSPQTGVMLHQGFDLVAEARWFYDHFGSLGLDEFVTDAVKYGHSEEAARAEWAKVAGGGEPQAEATPTAAPTPPKQSLADITKSLDEVWTPGQRAALRSGQKHYGGMVINPGAEGDLSRLEAAAGLVHELMAEAGVTNDMLKAKPQLRDRMHRVMMGLLRDMGREQNADMALRRNQERNRYPRLNSARIALARMEARTGTNFIDPFVKIGETSTKGHQVINDMLKQLYERYQLPKHGVTMPSPEAARTVEMWLYESDADAKAALWKQVESYGDELARFAKLCQEVTRGEAAHEVREARWWQWYDVHNEVAPKLAAAKLAVAEAKSEKAKVKAMVKVERYTEELKAAAPPNAPISRMMAGIEALQTGGKDGLRAFIRGETWGTRYDYFPAEHMDDRSHLDDLMEITPQVEDEPQPHTLGISKDQPIGTETRRGKGQARNVQSIIATIMHRWAKNYIYNRTRDEFKALQSAVRLANKHGVPLSNSDVAALNQHLRNATGRYVTQDEAMRVISKATVPVNNAWWRVYFLDPQRMSWWMLRQGLQQIAYGGSYLTPRGVIENIKTGAELMRKGKQWNAETREAMKEYPWRAAQKHEIAERLLRELEPEQLGTMRNKFEMLSDYLAEFASLSDEAPRYQTYAAAFEFALKMARQYAKDGNLNKLNGELGLDGFPETMSARLNLLAEADPLRFAKAYALMQTDIVNFRYAPADRAAIEQTPGARSLVGLYTFPRGTAELIYYKGMKLVYDGIRFKSPRLLIKGIMSLFGMMLSATLTYAMLMAVAGRGDYQLPGVLAYTPLSPGISQIVDIMGRIADAVRLSSTPTDEPEKWRKSVATAWLNVAMSPANATLPIRGALSFAEAVTGTKGMTAGLLMAKLLRLSDREFKATDRTAYEKIMHVIFGGFEEGTANKDLSTGEKIKDVLVPGWGQPGSTEGGYPE